MEFLKHILNNLPLIGALVIWAVHLEKKMTRMETDISWLKKELPGCRPTSENPTP